MNTQTPVVNRCALIKDMKAGGEFVGAKVETGDGDNRAMRVRIYTGEHSGEERHPGEYQLMEFTDSQFRP